jgi:hypothetical protein
MKVHVKVIPNAKKPEVIEEGGFLKVKVDAPPSRGEANERLIKILSKHFGVSRSQVKIIKGQKCREKVIEILR